MNAVENPDRMYALDREVMDAGFHGYEGCPLLDPRSEGSCPTPFLCSEKGDCGAVCPPHEFDVLRQCRRCGLGRVEVTP